jgi:hypothetical protein
MSHCCCCGSFLCDGFIDGYIIPRRSTGDMVQHMPFFGTTHGYYYFRPYHVMHVFSQQELATRWGGDPRNPYDNTQFQRIYEQMGVAGKSTKPVAVTTPAMDYVVPPGTNIVPTPVPTYGPNGSQYVPGAPYAPNQSFPPTNPAPPGQMLPPGQTYVPGMNMTPTPVPMGVPGTTGPAPSVEYVPAPVR